MTGNGLIESTHLNCLADLNAIAPLTLSTTVRSSRSAGAVYWHYDPLRVVHKSELNGPPAASIRRMQDAACDSPLLLSTGHNPSQSARLEAHGEGQPGDATVDGCTVSPPLSTVLGPQNAQCGASRRYQRQLGVPRSTGRYSAGIAAGGQ